jgi:hypothetical protein
LSAPLAIALVLAAGLSACGGGDEEAQLDEDSLRGCLAEEGLTLEAADLSASAGLGSASPDLRAVTAEGVAVDLIVLGSDRKAERAAADIRAARAGFGGGEGEVIADDNAVAVFDAAPSERARAAVEGCLGSAG